MIRHEAHSRGKPYIVAGIPPQILLFYFNLNDTSMMLKLFQWALEQRAYRGRASLLWSLELAGMFWCAWLVASWFSGVYNPSTSTTWWRRDVRQSFVVVAGKYIHSRLIKAFGMLYKRYLIRGAENAGVENAGVENAGVYRRCGKCRAGKCRSKLETKASSHQGQCIPAGYFHAHMLLHASGVNYNVNGKYT